MRHIILKTITTAIICKLILLFKSQTDQFITQESGSQYFRYLGTLRMIHKIHPRQQHVLQITQFLLISTKTRDKTNSNKTELLDANTKIVYMCNVQQN